MKIVLVHDYIKEFGGAERVLVELSKMYPKAKIYTAFVVRSSTVAKVLGNQRIRESAWGRLLKIGKLYSYLRFLLPIVWKGMDLREYDLVITSCSGYIARGFRVKKGAKVVAYCHTPPRWLYGYETPTGMHKGFWGKLYLFIFGPWVRWFDFTSAQRVDVFIANSLEVKQRIFKFYRKEASVVYPPCEISSKLKVASSSSEKSDKYWLIVSRLVGGKGIEQAIEAAVAANEKLVVVGDGPLGRELSKKYRAEKKIEWRGYIEDARMSEIYASAKGFLALATDEDFGMSVVEAMSYGVPVLAYKGGGYKESVVDGVNGRLVDSTQRAVISKEMKKWNTNNWDREKIAESVVKFGVERFEREIYARVA
jgi:glycosyltransferase involved in cell wall biosynthesis